MRRPIGIVRIRLIERGRVGWEYEGRNLFVNAGLPALAALLGGDTTGEFAAAVGFGTGSNAPTVTDSALTTTADPGAQGITIQELAIFANHASATLPGTTAPPPVLARKTIAPIVFGAGMSISGT